MTKKQAGLIIALLVVIVLGMVSILTVTLFRSDDAPEVQATAETTSSEPPTEPPTNEKVEDPEVVLAAAEVNSIHPAPTPDAPEEWGDYKIHDSWDGQVRVFEDGGPQEITAPNGERFPATMNSCGMVMYFVTFKSVNPNLGLKTHLINSLGESTISEEVDQGWSLSTNCETPAMEFLESEDTSNLGDVVYTVHEYHQSSVAPVASEPSTFMEEPVTAPSVVAEPTLVQCLGYLVPTGLYSDGIERRTQDCADSPEQRRSARAEGVCGGMYGWLEVSAEEYLDLCGIMPPTHLAPPPVVTLPSETYTPEAYPTEAYPTEAYPTEYYE